MEYLTSKKRKKTKEYRIERPRFWRFKCFALYLGFLGGGMTASVIGPTVPDLEELFQTDTQRISLALTINGIGYLIGSFLVGAIFDRINHELQIAVSLALIGLLTILSPLVGISGFIAFNTFRGMFMGFYDSMGQAYIMYQVMGHRLQDSLVQILHCIWSTGAMVGPLLVQPFLSPRTFMDDKTAYTTRGGVNQSTAGIVDLDGIPANTSIIHPEYVHLTTYLGQTITEEPLPATNVLYAYIVIGLVSIVSGIPAALIFLVSPKFSPYSPARIVETVSVRSNISGPEEQPRCFRLVMMIFMFFWYLFYAFAEQNPGNFLAVWSYKYLHWAKFKGPLLISTLWGSHLAGRVFGVGISAFLTPRMVVTYSVTLTTVGHVMLLTLHHMNSTVTWISVAVGGFGMGCLWGGIILWVSRHMPITGVVAAVVGVGFSSGNIVAPILTGYLFDNYSPFWFLYLVVGSAVINVLLYVCMELIAKLGKREIKQVSRLKSYISIHNSQKT